MLTPNLTPEQIIKRIRLRTDPAARRADAAMLRYIQDRAAPNVLRRAKEKAPLLFSDLKQSGRDYPIEGGARIVFGGLASAYAARQHEDDSISHTGPRKGKYVYRGAQTRTATGKPGEWNKPKRVPGSPAQVARYRARVTAWANAVTRTRPFYGGATGEALIEWSGPNWRFRRAGYASRYAASRYPKTGQAHFLFGRGSAAEELMPGITKEVAATGIRTLHQTFGKGT